MNTRWPSERTNLSDSELDQLERTLLPHFEKKLAQLVINKSLCAYLKPFYIPFAEWLRDKKIARNGPIVVGINGAQGSGKSTMSELLALILKESFGLSTAILSIDDIYKTRAQRQQMAIDIHPLFNTRGVPGTHDTRLGIDIIQQLKELKTDEILHYPRFDKGNDDRLPETAWPHYQGPIDIIIFEGWCVGAQAELDSQLALNTNQLEAQEDSQLVWRNTANTHLKTDYKKLFDLLDYLVFIQIPGFECVMKWRGLQEQKLADKHQHEKFLMTSPASLQRFIDHYERLTRHQLNSLPNIADLTIKLDDDHQIKETLFRRP